MRSHEVGRTMERVDDGTTEIPVEDILRELDARGATGLDMSPGDPICRSAARKIRELLAQVQEKKQTEQVFRNGEKVRVTSPSWKEEYHGEIGRLGVIQDIDVDAANPEHPLYRVKFPKPPGNYYAWLRASEIELAPPDEETAP